MVAYNGHMGHPLAYSHESTPTATEAEAYDRWLTAKVEHSIANPGKRSSHDDVMARMQAMLDRKTGKNTSSAAD